ncbi:hypothetical protein [Plasmodium yoelii yoelii]|uniref:Uncharacterized protein n=1 Tax=Plasmodium yoelii yoelii TaxID=73239 RepID=Q7RPW3_PLAYO|nr:hypothetical protein [Plasmodium yoelii yoelii]
MLIFSHDIPKYNDSKKYSIKNNLDLNESKDGNSKIQNSKK